MSTTIAGLTPEKTQTFKDWMKSTATFFQEGKSLSVSLISAYENVYPNTPNKWAQPLGQRIPDDLGGVRIFLSEESVAEIRKSKPDQLEVFIIDRKSDVESGYQLTL